MRDHGASTEFLSKCLLPGGDTGTRGAEVPSEGALDAGFFMRPASLGIKRPQSSPLFLLWRLMSLRLRLASRRSSGSLARVGGPPGLPGRQTRPAAPPSLPRLLEVPPLGSVRRGAHDQGRILAREPGREGLDDALLVIVHEDPDGPTSRRSSTAVSVLLTCCPPGPEERSLHLELAARDDDPGVDPQVLQGHVRPPRRRGSRRCAGASTRRSRCGARPRR